MVGPGGRRTCVDFRVPLLELVHGDEQPWEGLETPLDHAGEGGAVLLDRHRWAWAFMINIPS